MRVQVCCSTKDTITDRPSATSESVARLLKAWPHHLPAHQQLSPWLYGTLALPELAASAGRPLPDKLRERIEEAVVEHHQNAGDTMQLFDEVRSEHSSVTARVTAGIYS